MRENIKILDCTLRDGGFVNDWLFGNFTIRSVISRLDNAGVDIIECGFLDSNAEYNKDRSVFPDIPSIAKLIGNSLPKTSELVAMIDYGKFDKNLIIPKKDSVINGIRLIFKKEHVNEALEYAKVIQNQGYDLYLNPVALTSFHDIEILNLIEKINKINPYGMSIVDTYGLMFNHDLEKYIYLFDSNLNENITLGYHTHNNLQMGNANCILYINKYLKRNIVIDTSILGMGKNAGNACTELICAYLEKNQIKNIDLNQILECAFTDIMKFSSEQNWGYGIDTLLSAIHDCSPNWIDYYLGKNTLSVKSIRDILNSLPYEKREVSFFKKDFAEKKYLEYMDNQLDDTKTKNNLKELFGSRPVLIICPGKSIVNYKEKIINYIKEKNPIVISVNFISELYNIDYVFICNSLRYSQILALYPNSKIKPKTILTSNIVTNNEIPSDFIFNYKTLYEQIDGDISAVLLMALLSNLDYKNVAIAGMDGYDETSEDNFYNFDLRLSLNKYYKNVNNLSAMQLKKIINNINIEWLTPSKIKELL